jgi:hypothetical protein
MRATVKRWISPDGSAVSVVQRSTLAWSVTGLTLGTVLAVAIALVSRSGIDDKLIGLTAFIGALRAFVHERDRKRGKCAPIPTVIQYPNRKQPPAGGPVSPEEARL